MKKLLLLPMLLSLGCAEHIKEHWVVTGKEYEPGGMCCTARRSTVYSYVPAYVFPHAVVNQHRHRYEPARFIVYIGKPHCSSLFDTDSVSFKKYFVGQRIMY